MLLMKSRLASTPRKPYQTANMYICKTKKNPVKTLRWSAPLSLLLAATLYMLANIAYFAAASKQEILESKVAAASIFFNNIFGTSGASKALNFLICLSAFGNLIAVLIGQSRMLRECGRQGVLPWTKFWTSTRPFGTPLGPYFVKWVLTLLMILAPPAGDAFNFSMFCLIPLLSCLSAPLTYNTI